MKEKIVKKIKTIINYRIKKAVIWLYSNVFKLYKKHIIIKDENNNYVDLAPIESIEEVDSKSVYKNALNYATSNNNINNIAIVGPYGSGKSSLIKSFVKYMGLTNKEVLTISLSTFANKDSKNENEPINELEASILEQILYSNEEKSHKYSRLKRINVPKRKKAFKNFLMILIFGISISTTISAKINAFVISIIDTIVGVVSLEFTGINNMSPIYLRIFLLIGILINNIVVLFEIYRKFSSFTKINLSFSKVNLELNSSNGDSLLDKYIDEIFNFFKHNQYKMIIFEDLDRYQNIDIFERLKRINRLLNDNDEHFNNGVKFVYTIGDHMFKDERFKERTKFFDFVLPIIPVINSNNSIAALNDSFKRFDIKNPPDERLLKDVSYFIDDMRTLKNISNEFITYYRILVDHQDTNFGDKLFAIICYKNRYPYDFSEFQRNSGDLAQLITDCNKLRQEKIDEINQKINVIEERLNNFDSETASSIEEINDIYKMFLLKKMGNSRMTLQKNGRTLRNFNKEEIMSLENFDELFGDHSMKINSTNISIDDFKTLDNTSETYELRVEYIKLKKKEELETLKKDIEKLKRHRDNVYYYDFTSLVVENESNTIIQTFKKKYPLIFYFITNSYISSDYEKYISHFKEGHITSNDNTFLAKIKSKQVTEFNQNIDTPDEVMKNLVTSDFDLVSILNYTLIYYLVEKNDNRLQIILNKHKKNSEKIISFLSGFIKWVKLEKKNNDNIDVFMRHLYNKHDSIGEYCYKNRKSIQSLDDSLLDNFIGTMIVDLNISFENPNAYYFCEYILNHENILNLIPYSSEGDLKKLLITLKQESRLLNNLSFINNIESNNFDFTKFILKNKLYKFNFLNLNQILISYNNGDVDPLNINHVFDTLRENSIPSLRENVFLNKDIFMGFLKKFDSVDTLKQKNLIYCINKICITEEDVQHILNISNENTVIDYINNVNNNYIKLLIVNNRVAPSYTNIFEYDKIFGIDENILNFINQHIHEFGVYDELNDRLKQSLVSIIKKTDNENILKKISSDFKNLIVTCNMVNSDVNKLILLIKTNYNIDIDKELIALAEKNNDLMTELAEKYYLTIKDKDIKIQIKSEVMISLYERLQFSEFARIFDDQIPIQKDTKKYMIKIINVFTKENFKQYLSRYNDKNYKASIALDYVQRKELSKEFIVDLMIIIDEGYHKFKTKDHFSIKGEKIIEKLLGEFKDKGFLNYKHTVTDKLEIWLYKEQRI